MRRQTHAASPRKRLNWTPPQGASHPREGLVGTWRFQKILHFAFLLVGVFGKRLHIPRAAPAVATLATESAQYEMPIDEGWIASLASADSSSSGSQNPSLFHCATATGSR